MILSGLIWVSCQFSSWSINPTQASLGKLEDKTIKSERCVLVDVPGRRWPWGRGGGAMWCGRGAPQEQVLRRHCAVADDTALGPLGTSSSFNQKTSARLLLLELAPDGGGRRPPLSPARRSGVVALRSVCSQGGRFWLRASFFRSNHPRGGDGGAGAREVELSMWGVRLLGRRREDQSPAARGELSIDCVQAQSC